MWDGAFIIGVIKRKVKHNMERFGLSKSIAILKALDTTFGMDIMADNIRECRRRVFRDIVLAAVSRYSKKMLSR